MSPELQGLMERLETYPRDAVSLQALADWLEEKGAEPDSVRSITIEGPTVLVFGLPEEMPVDLAEHLRQQIKFAMDWMQGKTGHPIMAMIVPDTMTIRKIKIHEGMSLTSQDGSLVELVNSKAEEKKDEPG